MKKWRLSIGILIFIFSLILAFHYKYNHFYEFTLIGLVLILSCIISLNLNKNQYIKLYIYLLFLSIILDPILGITISKLWYYNYSNIIEYVFLYLLIYPLGGIVMIQSFLLFKNKIFEMKDKFKKINSKILEKIILILLILIAITIYKNSMSYFGFILCSLSVLILLFSFNYISIKLKKKSFFERIITNKKMFIIIILISSYIQGLIHEIPNVYSKQWVYQNFPLQEIQLLGIPIIVLFVGWIALTILPVSIYYIVKK